MKKQGRFEVEDYKKKSWWVSDDEEKTYEHLEFKNQSKLKNCMIEIITLIMIFCGLTIIGYITLLEFLE